MPHLYKGVCHTLKTSLRWMRIPILVICLVVLAQGTYAQSAPPDPVDMGDAVYYAVERQAMVYSEPNKQRPYVRLGFREPVYVLSSDDGWSRVHTQDGAYGYVPSEAISNVWIRVSKLRRRLYLYQGTRLVMELPADFGFNTYSDKEKRGSEAERDHWRTPEGAFFVVRKNPRSQFYKALLLNYPNAEDAERGLRKGLISQSEHDAIMAAEEASKIPPMHTPLGGMIEIHGAGTGLSTNWTQGCVAVENSQMDRLWGWVQEGTPVIIE